MNKKPEINNQLLQSWIAGDCTPEEKRAVEKWLSESPEHIDLVEYLAQPNKKILAGFDADKVKTKIFNDIDQQNRHIFENHHPRQKPGMAWWFRAAAMVLVIVTAGMVGWIHHVSQTEEALVYKETTSPAGTITTLTLSDGTHVELNANSRLRYPVTFQHDQREVFLEGEAFFSVKSDAERPFKVQSGHLTTTVLGTEFNVNYMPALGRVDVALVEGSVSVGTSLPNSSLSEITLKPNQWVSYSDNQNTLNIQEGVRDKILWRDGILEFEGKTILEVASVLENWYGVEIIVEDPSSADMKVTGTFEDESLEHVLETLKFVAGIEYVSEKNNENEIVKIILKNEES